MFYYYYPELSKQITWFTPFFFLDRKFYLSFTPTYWSFSSCISKGLSFLSLFFSSFFSPYSLFSPLFSFYSFLYLSCFFPFFFFKLNNRSYYKYISWFFRYTFKYFYFCSSLELFHIVEAWMDTSEGDKSGLFFIISYLFYLRNSMKAFRGG